MELNLIVPIDQGAEKQQGDEEINGRLWRVTGPHDPKHIKNHKFYCISYVWGPGQISDKTRPALEATIKAAKAVQAESKRGKGEAFWIDAICIPQLEGYARHATLER
jgi:hypothetical protein